MTLSTTTSGNQGIVSYTWTFNQTSGTTVSGVSIGSGTPSVTFTYPTTITYAGDGAVSGTYSFSTQCITSDSAVALCNQVRSRILYFNDTPLTCSLTMTPITVS